MPMIWLVTTESTKWRQERWSGERVSRANHKQCIPNCALRIKESTYLVDYIYDKVEYHPIFWSTSCVYLAHTQVTSQGIIVLDKPAMPQLKGLV